jgi:hypothetical protein
MSAADVFCAWHDVDVAPPVTAEEVEICKRHLTKA